MDQLDYWQAIEDGAELKSRRKKKKRRRTKKRRKAEREPLQLKMHRNTL